MEDVLTDIPPPSRFFLEDLNNFTPPPTPLPSPFILFSNPNSNRNPLRPSLLIVALSAPSLYLLHHLSSKTLIGSLVLPEIPFSGNSLEPSLKDKSCNLYVLDYAGESIVLASFQYSVPADRSHSIVKLLIGEHISPERVLILDSIQPRNFRGKLSPDDTFALKLETTTERKGEPLLKDLNYFPSGSVVDGLAAALLSRCQMKNIKGTLCVSWPEFGGSVTSLLKSLVGKDIMPGIKDSIGVNGGNGSPNFDLKKDYPLDSEMYT